MNDDNLIIATDKLVDASLLRSIACEAYQQYVLDIGKKPAPMVADYEAHLCQDIVITARRDGLVAGFVILILKQDGYWLETIAVRPPFMGSGIGRSLITFAETIIAKTHSDYQLYTNIKMTRNLDWYPALGFVKTDIREEAGFQRVYFKKILK